MKRSFILFVCIGLVFCIGTPRAFSQKPDALSRLSKQALEASTSAQMYSALDALKSVYLAEHRYADFIDFLDSLAGKKKTQKLAIDYFAALTRYEQLLYLEDNQLWDEYFSMGNTYRDDITERAGSVRAAALPGDPAGVYARIVLWRFHQHQQDAFLEESRDDLIAQAASYAASVPTEGPLDPVKDAADALLAAGERSRAKQLYRLYVEKIRVQGLTRDQTGSLAQAFLAEGNGDLAQSMYDLYIEDLIKNESAESASAALLDIAGSFVYRPEGVFDMAYAESLFSRAEELGGKGALSEELLYRRAANLQAAGEYEPAKRSFEEILAAYPESRYRTEAGYKVGLITAYILRDRQEARKLFEVVSADKGADEYQAASLYHLGLLSQWEGQKQAAEGYYGQVLKSATEMPSLAALTRKRLEEIEADEDLAYNLKTFLDLTFLPENVRFDRTKVTLTCDPKALAVDEETSVEARPVLGPTGCFQVDVQYMWSGLLGSASVGTTDARFQTSFAEPGVKEIFIVVNSPTGFLDRNLLLIDVE